VNPSALAPALIALGATLEIVGPNSKTRQVAVAEFFRKPTKPDERENVLAPNELITQIMIPAKGLANATYEVRPRQGLDWPLVAAAVSLPRAGGQKAEIVLGHVAPIPWRVPKAAAVLAGRPPDEELATRAAEAAAEGATPLSGNRYKVRLVKTAVKRAILSAAEKMRA
jgi:xanthine dehydrogenase YagS FAD-binding subunit